MLKGQNRSPVTVTWNAAAQTALFGPLNIAANQTLDIKQDRVVILQPSKILAISVVGSAFAGAPQIQIGVGNALPGTVTAADADAVNGDAVFANSVAIDVNATGSGQVLLPAQRDAIYPAGTVLTLRAVTGGADTATNLKIGALIVPFSATVSSGTSGDIGVTAAITP